MVAETPVSLRRIPDPPGITTARTLPASWYSDPSFFVRERDAVFRDGWVCIGVTDELPAPGSWHAREVSDTPVLIVRDRSGELRAFLNVCRHRAAPLCAEGEVGSGPILRCPYHAWLYRLDGTLAKAANVGRPEGFVNEDFSLKSVAIATWRRCVFVHLGSPTATLDLGPLADAGDGFPLETLTLSRAESDRRRFNWKVLVENYSENYHTPFVHPEIDTTAVEDYPMVSDGPVLYAWDRTLHPADPDEVIRATLLPGEPGWEQLGVSPTGRPYDVGSYLTVWPNLMINLFPDAALVMWVEPIDATVSVVHRRLYVGTDGSDADATGAAHAVVHRQDVAICEQVQRSHNAGISADGVLATVEERGVYFVHEHLRAALGVTGSSR